MKRRTAFGFLILAVAILGAAPGRSGSVQVSAISANQMRLSVTPENGWTVSQFENLVEIRFPGLAANLVAEAGLLDRLSPLLQGIDAELLEDDVYLRLTLGCACQVAMMKDGLGQMTITVIDPESVLANSGARMNVPEAPAPLKAPLPSAKPQGQTRPRRNDGAVDVEEARSRLFEQLMRAAEAGIVDLDPGQNVMPSPEEFDTASTVLPVVTTLTKDASMEPQQSDTPEPVQEFLEEAFTAPLSEPTQVNPITSISETTELKLVAMPAQSACFEDAAFVFPEIVGPHKFVEAIQEYNRRLVGEFDAPDAAVALNLARAYLGQGFAEEARATIESFVHSDGEGALLREIAMSLSSMTLAEVASLRKVECVGDQALWRAYVHATEGADSAALLAEKVAGRALERLPLHLREILAARLGHAAANEGDWETARRMEAMAIRATPGRGGRNGDSLLLSARLADWNGEALVAWDLCQAARHVGPPHADKALLEIAETVLRSENLFSADSGPLQLELGSLARQARGTALGADAFELEARLAARFSGRDGLIELLREGVRAGLLSPDRQVALLSELINEPSQNEFSRPMGLIYLDDPSRFADAITQPAFREAVITSLAKLGLPRLADPLVALTDRQTEHVVVPLAKAHLETGNPREALDLARGLKEGPTRDTLMAAALSATGQGNGSIDHLSGLSDESPEAASVRRQALEHWLSSAIEGGNMMAALSVGEKLMVLEPTMGRAEQVVMLALMAGATEIPAKAAAVLSRIAPKRAQELAGLFKPVPSAEVLVEETAAEELLQRLDVEIGLLEGLLADG